MFAGKTNRTGMWTEQLKESRMTPRFLDIVMVDNGTMYWGEKSDGETGLGRRKKK